MATSKLLHMVHFLHRGHLSSARQLLNAVLAIGGRQAKRQGQEPLLGIILSAGPSNVTGMAVVQHQEVSIKRLQLTVRWTLARPAAMLDSRA